MKTSYYWRSFADLNRAPFETRVSTAEHFVLGVIFVKIVYKVIIAHICCTHALSLVISNVSTSVQRT